MDVSNSLELGEQAEVIMQAAAVANAKATLSTAVERHAKVARAAAQDVAEEMGEKGILEAYDANTDAKKDGE